MVAAKEEARKEVTVRDLLDAGLHFGHQTKRWNPKMKRYIFGKRNGIHIIDLSKSLVKLNEALDFLKGVINGGRSVLFVGTKKQAQEIIKGCAVDCSQHYVTHRWLGGTLTNNSTIRKSIERMRELEGMEKADNFGAYHKQEASGLRRELEKLRRNLSGIAQMRELPGALFVIDISREAIAVKEAQKLNIPVVAIVDTNCDPDPIEYLIPGNDDSLRAIKLIGEAVSATLKTAAAEYAKIAAEMAKKREADKAEAEAKRAAERAAREAASKAKSESDAKDRKTASDAKAAAQKKPVTPDRKIAALAGTRGAELIAEEDVAPEDAEVPAAPVVDRPAKKEAPRKPARKRTDKPGGEE